MKYIFGGNTGVTYEDLQRKRALAQGLTKQTMNANPTTFGGGLNALGGGIGAILASRKANKMQQQGQADFMRRHGGLFAKGGTQRADIARLLTAGSNGFANPAQKAMIQHAINTRLAQDVEKRNQADPMYQMKLKQGQHSMNMDNKKFGLLSQGQAFDQNMSVKNHNLQAQGQQFNQGMSIKNHNLQAQGQAFNQNMANNNLGIAQQRLALQKLQMQRAAHAAAQPKPGYQTLTPAQVQQQGLGGGVWQRSPQGKLVKAADPMKPQGGRIDFETEQKLRKEYSGVNTAKNFRDQTNAYQRVLDSSKDSSAAGDLALIFNYMKVLDPGSVVRESEFATAAASGSYGSRIEAAVNKVRNGERLDDDMRKDFVNRAGNLYEGAADLMGGHNKHYTNLAAQYNLDPARIVYDIPQIGVLDQQFDLDAHLAQAANPPIQLPQPPEGQWMTLDDGTEIRVIAD